MDTNVTIVLERIATSLAGAELSLKKLTQDSEELEERVIRMEQQIEVSSHSMKGFWERDWGNMMAEIKSINDKLQTASHDQGKGQNEVELLKQRMDFVVKVYDEKINKLEITSQEGQMALWKLLGAGAGSGAVITGIIQFIQTLT